MKNNFRARGNLVHFVGDDGSYEEGLNRLYSKPKGDKVNVKVTERNTYYTK